MNCEKCGKKQIYDNGLNYSTYYIHDFNDIVICEECYNKLSYSEKSKYGIYE